MPHPRSLSVRPVKASDLDELQVLNNAAVPAVNELDAEALKELVDTALICLVAELDGRVSGFLLCLAEGEAYDSRNYVWLSNNRERFAYTDRICVAECARGNRIGEALYEELFKAEKESGRPFVCEVNERPPNPGSVKFHKRLGFNEIGRQDHGDKAVVYMERTND
jgi:predicted GNAT superfamily acetyltransferase